LSDANPDDFSKPGTQTAQAKRPLQRRESQAAAGTTQTEYIRQLAADRMGEALLRARQLDSEWKPQPRAYDPNNIEAETRAYREIAQEANARASFLERDGVPHGFGSRAEFEEFGRNTRTMLEDAGYPEAEVYLRGSSITGYRFTDGRPFDGELKPSDLDLAIVSARLFDAARNVRVPSLGTNTRTVPLNATKLRELGLESAIKEIKINRGRDASIVIFRSQEALGARGASTPITAVRSAK
jgi:hypothetical protein